MIKLFLYSYENEAEELEATRTNINDQEDLYDLLMEEKEAMETEMWKQKVMVYIQNRSARRIQRQWRAFQQRRLDRKRSRRGELG